MTGRVARRVPAAATAACAVLACICASAAFAPAGYAAAKAVKPGVPTVSTGRTRVQGASVTLLGSVNPRGSATTYFFQFGATVAYGKQTTPATLPAGIATVKVGQQAPGMLPGYHYRLVASNSFGPSKLGRDRIFTTSTQRRSKFSLVKPKVATVYGAPVTLTGTLTGTGNAARKIVLQESPYPFLTPFASIGLPTVTGPTGAFSFRVPRLLATTQFRVSTLDPRPVYSSLVTVDAAYRVTLRVKGSSRKGIVRLYGTVTPAAVGARVLLQLRKKVRPGTTEKTEERTTRFATQFSTSLKRGTKTVSRFSVIVKVRKGGTYQARVEPVKRGAFVAGTSAMVLLHAAP